MVLFLFVIMLLNLPREETPWAPRDLKRILTAIVLSVALLAELVIVVGRHFTLTPVATPEPAGFGTTQMIGRLLFSQFLFPFEITSIILLVAIVGAMVLAKKHLT
jgi:NADH-quinone oxidoreductase subunit J